MIPVGYMFKTVSEKPGWLKTTEVQNIYSVSGCVSEDFSNWFDDWKHNGYWLFDNPELMKSIAKNKNISLQDMKLFFYRASEIEWDISEAKWNKYQPEESFTTNIEIPIEAKLEGFDVVSFSQHTSCECSPLSCNSLAEEIKVNSHCLLPSYEKAKALIESGKLKDCEPGPYRIFEVYSVTHPTS